MNLVTRLGLAAALLLTACGSNTRSDSNASLDGGGKTTDTSEIDAGADTAAARLDVGAPDTAMDSGAPDALLKDAAPNDVAIDGGAVDAGCSGWTALKRLSPAELSSLMATTDPVVINVHVPYEGDIPGTDTDIPYTNIDAIEAYLHGDHCADVVLVCLGGSMSLSAGNQLIKRGYLRVRDLSGGMQAWQAAGYPLLKDGGT